MRMRIQQSGLHRSTVSVNHAGSCKHRTQINCKRMPVRTLRQAALFPIRETKQAVPHKNNWEENPLIGFGGTPMSWSLLTAFCVMNDTDCRAWLKGIDTPCTLDARLARSLLWRNECEGKNLPCIRLDSDTSLVSNPTGILRPEVPYWCHYSTSVTKLQDSLPIFCETLCISNNSSTLFLWKNGNIFA